MLHLMGQPNKKNVFDWLKFNMKNKACFTVSVRIPAMESIVNAYKTCTYIQTLLRTLQAGI